MRCISIVVQFPIYYATPETGVFISSCKLNCGLYLIPTAIYTFDYLAYIEMPCLGVTVLLCFPCVALLSVCVCVPTFSSCQFGWELRCLKFHA